MNRLITPDEFTAEIVRSMNKAEDEAGVPRGSIAKAWIEAFNKRSDGADDESRTATSIAMSLGPTRGEALADRVEAELRGEIFGTQETPLTEAEWRTIIAALRAQRPEGMALVPTEPPESIPDSYDSELFDLCRNDDYRGLYRVLVRRAIGSPPPP